VCDVAVYAIIIETTRGYFMNWAEKEDSVLQELNRFFNRVDNLRKNSADYLKQKYIQLYGQKQFDERYATNTDPHLKRQLWLEIFRKEHNDKNANMFSFSADDIEKYNIPSYVVGCSGRADLFAKYADKIGIKDVYIVPCVKTSDIGKQRMDGHQIIAIKNGDNLVFLNPSAKNNKLQDALILGVYKKYSPIDATQSGQSDYIIADIITPEQHSKIKSYDDLRKIYDSDEIRNIAQQIKNISARLKNTKFKKATGKLLINNYLRNSIKDFGDWSSSAKELEEDLRHQGINLPDKLYHEYKFPNGMTNVEFYNLTVPIMAGYIIAKSLITNNQKADMWAKEDLHMHINMAPYDLATFIKFNCYLAAEDPKTLRQQLVTKHKNCVPIVEKLVKQLKKLNPELQNLNHCSDYDLWGGCCYGFAPAEIDFFGKLENKRAAWSKDGIDWYYYEHNVDPESKHAHDNIDKIEQLTNVRAGYILAPTTSDKILTAIQQQKIMQMNNRNSKDYV
jgi:hypothetical protein